MKTRGNTAYLKYPSFLKTKKLIRFFCLLFLLTGFTNANASDIRVTGKITGDNGEALSGVSITVKGTSIGTTSDANGMFAINAPNGTSTLVISYVGYATQEIAIGNRTSININLAQARSTMDEVVVIGYGTASKRDLTGSIVKISGKEVADKPNTNPVASLQGKVAGLSVVNNGTPGQAPDIRIRGTVSIGQVHPLYVVDGILNDNIDYLNPNDIESIEILKDPSSLAIFGVKGATGVIAITTKKAKAGQVLVNLNSSYGFKKLVDKIKMANADQFKTLFAEENANNGITTPFDYTGLTANTNWIDAVTRNAQFSNNNISISSATDRNNFRMGIGYLYDEGIIRHEKLDRITLALADELKVSNAIKIGFTINGARQNDPYDATGVLDAARKVVPMVSSGAKNFTVKNPYGNDTINIPIYSGLNTDLQNSGVFNPLLYTENEWNTFKKQEYRTVGSVYADISFLRHFNLRTTYYGDISNVTTRHYTPIYYAYDPKTNTPYIYSQTTKFQEDDENWKKWQQDYILNYRNSFGNHNLTVTAGFTTYYFNYTRMTGNASQAAGPTALPIPNDPRFWYISSGFQDLANTSTNSDQYENATVSVLGRILYNYKGKYFLNASFRDDGSSQIPQQNRFQQFWAVGGAWEISKEDFLNGQHFFNYLKLKASAGTLGNQTSTTQTGLPLPYPFYPNLNSGTVAVFGTNIHTAADQAYIVNSDLKWETVNAQEAGVELSALNNRLHFEANYFNKVTNNLMTFVDRSAIGLKSKLENGGSFKNFGEEFSATWNQNFNKDLSLNVSGNITFLKTRVLSLSSDLPTGVLSRNFQNNGEAESRTQPGYPIGYFYGYVVTGVFQSYADVLKSPNQSALGTYGPGDLKFKDVNGDGKITPDDRTMIGNPTPKFMYGGTISLTYKKFNLAIDINGVYGNQVFRNWGALESPFQRTNYAADIINRWHGPGTSNWVPLVSLADRVNFVGSTYSIEDGSYFRIRNVQLGYTFGQVFGRTRIKNLRIYLNVQNLKTFKNNSGYTPEFGGEPIAFGYDNAGGAIPLVGTVGINVNF